MAITEIVFNRYNGTFEIEYDNGTVVTKDMTLIENPATTVATAVAQAVVASAPLVVTGTPEVGETLTATLLDGYTATGYQWTRDGVNITDETVATYVLVEGDLDTNVSCVASGLAYTAGIDIPDVA